MSYTQRFEDLIIPYRTNADKAVHHADKLSLIRSTETVLPEQPTFRQTKSMKVYTPVAMLD
jgi:hypothetical protein